MDGDRLYVLGGSGDLTCLETATGKKIWSINIVQKFGGVNPYWGYSESPLIVGDRILVNTGGRRAGIVAVSKADGSTLWQQHNDGAGYSSPMLMRTGSLNQVIYFTEDRAMAVDPRDGRLLWSYNKANNGTANIATPIVRGTFVFVSSDYGTGGALLDVRAAGNLATANEVYFTRDMRNHHASSVLVGDHLYGFSSSILTALAFETGKTVWRDRSVGKGSLDLRRQPPVSLQRGQRGRPCRCLTGRIPRTRPLHTSATKRPADLEPPDDRRRTAGHSGSGRRLYLRRPDQIMRGAAPPRVFAVEFDVAP